MQHATIANEIPIVNRVIESDYSQHIEDSRLFTVWRQGHLVKRSWNELTSTERLQLQEADAYCILFCIY